MAAGAGAAAGAAIAARPGVGTRPAFGDRPGLGDRPGVGDRPGLGDKPGLGDRPADRQARLDHRQNRAQGIRDQFSRHHPRHDFWRGHPNAARWHYNRPYRWATWAALTAWFPWGGTWGSSGQYYDYGGNVVYEGDSIYVDGEQIATIEEYSDQAFELADHGAQAIDEALQQETEIEWMSLGVFALADEESGDATKYLQLAVSHDGLISGAYRNMTADQTLPVEGSVDKETQRAAWSIGDNRNTIMETGVYNFTQNETPVLVHFGNQQTETWLMVRMEEPESEKKPE